MAGYAAFFTSTCYGVTPEMFNDWLKEIEDKLWLNRRGSIIPKEISIVIEEWDKRINNKMSFIHLKTIEPVLANRCIFEVQRMSAFLKDLKLLFQFLNLKKNPFLFL
jgi:hypothetical protein